MSATLPGVGAAVDRHTPAEARRVWRWLGMGALAGVVAGALAARPGEVSPGGTLPSGVIARVDGRPIAREELERALSSLAADRREPPGPADRARVLSRLVDEELLVQHALQRGLLARDRALRDVIVRAMVESAVAAEASRAPGEEELRAFYAAQRTSAGAPARTSDAASLPAFEDLAPPARAQLEQAFAAEARDAALRTYLGELRAGARIETFPEKAK